MGRGGGLAPAVASVQLAYYALREARTGYESAMLRAIDKGHTFAELARATNLSEPAVRGFVRRAQRRRDHVST